MSTLAHTSGSNGSVEVYGASIKIEDAITSNFEERGRQAASLLLVTLTETPHTPTIGRQEFSMPVTNVYVGDYEDYEVDQVESVRAKDTVEVATEALQEYLTAEVPGSTRLTLSTYRTGYRGILKLILPDAKTPSTHSWAFEEAFVETSRQQGVEIKSPEQGIAIINSAPAKLAGLRLSDHSRDGGEQQKHLLVTTSGRLVDVWSIGGVLCEVNYFLPARPRDLHLRGGRAPGSTISQNIQERAVELRTRQTAENPRPLGYRLAKAAGSIPLLLGRR